MTREKRKEYMKIWRAEHREVRNSRQREKRSEHKEEYNAIMRNYRSERREEWNLSMKKRRSVDLNSHGFTKMYIRTRSRKILENCHAKLSGYEIHHCFGYESPEKFIYIPRDLHLKIHQILRDKKIPAESDHWKNIAEIVNECENYTYIRA